MCHAVIRALSLILVLGASSAEAFHGLTPPLLQIPPVAQSPGTIANPSWGGIRYVLFDSDADLLSNGSTGPQVFVFDLQVRDLQKTLGISQLTTAALDDSQRATTGHRGASIVYDARIGGIGPRQLMLFNRRSGTRTQLSAGTLDSQDAMIDYGERIVVFESAADFFATGVGGTQIYSIDLKRALLGCPFPCAASSNAGLSQLTNKAGNSHNAVTTTNGKWIYFESDADLANVGESENQIYRFDGKNGGISRVTHGPGAARNPSVSRDGRSLVFESDANLTLSGTGGTQIFLYGARKGTLRQMTAAPGGASTNPAISGTGHAFAFVSPDDLLGLGSTGPELYSYSLKREVMVQLTNAPSSVSTPAYAAGVFTVFLGSGDIAGTGSPGTQLLLVNLYALGNQVVP